MTSSGVSHRADLLVTFFFFSFCFSGNEALKEIQFHFPVPGTQTVRFQRYCFAGDHGMGLGQVKIL